MTTRSRHWFMAVLLFPAAALGAGNGPKDTQEPPQLFSLEAGGKSTVIELDKPFNTNVLAGNPSATLRVRPYRVFPYGGIKFHYPREYTFEADFTQRAWSFGPCRGAPA